MANQPTHKAASEAPMFTLPAVESVTVEVPTKDTKSATVTFRTKPGYYPVFNAVLPRNGGQVLNFINGVYTTEDAYEIAYLREMAERVGYIQED